MRQIWNKSLGSWLALRRLMFPERHTLWGAWLCVLSGCAYGLTKDEEITSHGTDGSRDAGAVATTDDDDDEDDSVPVTDDGDADSDRPDASAQRDAAVLEPDLDGGTEGDAGVAMDAGTALPDAGGEAIIDAGDDSVTITGVTFKTVPGSRYVGESSGLVVATATAPAGPQTLELRDLNGGTLDGGDTVTVQAASGGLFQATNGGGSTLLVALDHPEWQTFRVVRKAGAGRVVNGEIVGLQTLATGRWVSAENGGGGPVFVYGHGLMVWEELVISGLP
jgi:hypothetical protein